VVADKAYDSRALIGMIHDHGAPPVILLPRANSRYPREFDPQLCKAHNLVERVFNRVEQFQHVAARYDNLDGLFSRVRDECLRS